MTLRYGIQSSKDLFQKIVTEGSILDKEITSYVLFNFVTSAYHLCEWIEKDSNIPLSAKKAVAKVRANQSIAICRDLTNATKHFKLNSNYKNQIVSNASSSSGFGIGRFGHGRFGIGEEGIKIDLDDGSTIGVLKLKDDVIKVWAVFFQTHGI